MKSIHSNMADLKSRHFQEAFTRLERNGSERLEILELGIGCGENFKNFPRGSNVTILDKTDIFLPYLNDSIKKNNRQDLNVSRLVLNSAESMVEIESDSMDVVVHTLMLCSVSDYSSVLSEIYRVLKPGGICIFMEHSLDNKNVVRKLLQKFLENPLNYCRFLDMNNVIKDGLYEELVIKEHNIPKFYMTHVNPIVYGYGVKSTKSFKKH
ncbi:methyltransferase 7A [Brachionus plicatilis]|uniref:Methyltransferase 7A n=1 Tax=Brachionus plicatilis TaxID=10195 RepID=A0A3M7RKK7_BRAPC|nr:methyltransferase 7A [Brachionus plicatilis]